MSEWFGEFMCVFGDWLKLLEIKIKIYELFSKLPVKNNLKKKQNMDILILESNVNTYLNINNGDRIHDLYVKKGY